MGRVRKTKKGTREMSKSNQSSLDIADHLSRGEYDWCPEAETRLKEQHDLIRKQQAEIETMKERNLFLESIYRTIKVQTR